MKLRIDRRDIILVVAGAFSASVLLVPAGAHVGGTISHVFEHVKPKVKALAYTKAQADGRFLGKESKAVNSQQVDGKDSSELLPTMGTAADSETLDGIDASALPLSAEDLRLLGAAGEPSLNPGSNGFENGVLCNWSAFAPGAQAPPGFYKDGDGVVHIQGIVQAHDGIGFNVCGQASDRRIFTLPEGYRPSFIRTFLVLSNDAVSRVNIGSDGNVIVVPVDGDGWTDAKAWLNLDGIRFRTAPQP